MTFRLGNTGFLLLVGVGLLALAAYLRYDISIGEPAVIIDEPDQKIESGQPGLESIVTFRLHNRADRAATIIGLSTC